MQKGEKKAPAGCSLSQKLNAFDVDMRFKRRQERGRRPVSPGKERKIRRRNR